MTHTVRASTFEGPFGLLLELVEGGRLEVTELSVGEITAEYLKRVKAMDDTSESMSEFLQLGSRLIYIKSLALLPATNEPSQADELDKLHAELEEYRKFQLVARSLHQLGRRRSWTRDVVTTLPTHELPLPQIDVDALTQAFERALQRSEPTLPSGQIGTVPSQSEVMDRLIQKLSAGPRVLDDCMPGNPELIDVVVTFLAILELLKAGRLRVQQTGQFATISLELAHV